AYSEGRGWIARLMAVAPHGERGEAHAAAFHAAGSLALRQADYAAAEEQHLAALAIWRQLGGRGQIARSIGSGGNVTLQRGDYSGARALYEQALTIMREMGDRRDVAAGLWGLGNVTYLAGDLAAAEAFLQESLPISREIGPSIASYVLELLGRIRQALA